MGFKCAHLFVAIMAILVPIADAHAETRLRRSDEAVKTDIQRTLNADRSLDDSQIIVKSVNRGDVILGGSATSIPDIIRALQLTASRIGVRRVYSDIEAAKPRSRLGRVRRPTRRQLATERGRPDLLERPRFDLAHALARHV